MIAKNLILYLLQGVITFSSTSYLKGNCEKCGIANLEAKLQPLTKIDGIFPYKKWEYKEFKKAGGKKKGDQDKLCDKKKDKDPSIVKKVQVIKLSSASDIVKQFVSEMKVLRPHLIRSRWQHS